MSISITISGVIKYIITTSLLCILLKKHYHNLFRGINIPKKIQNIQKRTKILKKYDDQKIKEALNNLNNDKINTFHEVLKNNFKKDFLTPFYNNLLTLKINNEKGKFISLFPSKKNIAGEYKSNSNEILLINDDENTIYHELFHMASTVNKTTGFHQTKNIFNIVGQGLNEGYTEALTAKYFEKYQLLHSGLSSNAYPIEKYTTTKLEPIIGEEKMQELYFSADLHGLIMELTKYEEIDKVMKFITNLDYIKSNAYEEEAPSSIKKRVQNCIEYNNLFLTKCYITKLNQEIEEYKIQPFEAESLFRKWIRSFERERTIHNFTYKFKIPNQAESLPNQIIKNDYFKESTLKLIKSK